MFFNGHLHSALLHNKTVSSRNKKYRERKMEREMETSRDILIHGIGIPEMSDTEERKYERKGHARKHPMCIYGWFVL